MLSADGLLSCLNAPLQDDPLANESQQVIECEYTQLPNIDESADVQIPVIEMSANLPSMSEFDTPTQTLSLTLDDNITPQSEQKTDENSDNFNLENVGLVNTNQDNSEQSDEQVGGTNNKISPALVIDITAGETAIINPLITFEDDSEPETNSGADLSIEYATSIEPRAPPIYDMESSNISELDAYAFSGEIAESSDVGSMYTPTAPELPGLVLVDTDISSWEDQVFYLDFDGAEDVIYNGPVTVGPFDVPAFVAPDGLAGQEDLIIFEILTRLEQIFAETGIIFTTEQPAGDQAYSTIYIGGNDSAFTEYG